MGDVFESTMPEEHYMKKIADLESKLQNAEMMLIKHLTRLKAIVANNETDIESHMQQYKELKDIELWRSEG